MKGRDIMAHPANKHEGQAIARRKLQRLYEETKHAYGAGAYFDTDKGRILKYTCNSKELRQSHNRRFRRKHIDVASGGAYKKHSDYWWDLL